MKQKSQQTKTSEKQRTTKEKRERTPREATALALGIMALGLSVGGVVGLIWVSVVVGAILGGFSVLFGFAALMVGKGGTFPAVIGIGAGFLTVLSAIVTMRLQ